MKLKKIIMTPAMIASWIFGILMLVAIPDLLSEGWMHVKLTGVILMSAVHGVLSKHVRLFANDSREKTSKYYRIVNEIPTILMIVIVIMAVVQPF